MLLLCHDAPFPPRHPLLFTLHYFGVDAEPATLLSNLTIGRLTLLSRFTCSVIHDSAHFLYFFLWISFSLASLKPMLCNCCTVTTSPR